MATYNLINCKNIISYDFAYLYVIRIDLESIIELEQVACPSTSTSSSNYYR